MSRQTGRIPHSSGMRRSISTQELTKLRARIHRMAFLSRLSLTSEHLVRALAPMAAILASFVGLALMDILPSLPGWAHGLALAAFGGAVVWAGIGVKRAFSLPSQAEALRRIEAENGAVHNPLTTLTDEAAIGGGAVWRAHLTRIAASVRGMRIPRPAPKLASVDRFGIGAAVGLVFVIGIIVGGHEPGIRLANALKPNISFSGDRGPVRLDAWIDPPRYTGFAPVVLAAGEAIALPETARVPAGSMLVARLVGLDDDVALTFSETGEPELLSQAGQNSLQIETEILEGDRVALTRGDETLATWPMTVVPDMKPQPVLTDIIQKTARGAMRIPFAVTDDYGVASSELVVSRPGSGEEPLRTPLASAREEVDEGAKVSGIAFKDLTAHPWAGLEVTVEIQGTDEIGQIGRSTPLEMTLPERLFTHPVAREIVEQRKRLAASADNLDSVATAIRDIATQPQRYGDDLGVFLGLKVAHSRLRSHGQGEENQSVMRLLWEIALHLEDGDVTLTAEQLRELEQRIMEGLQEGQSADELDAMLDELQSMVDDMLRALSEDARKNAPEQDGESQPMDPQQMVTRDQLQEMVEQIREMMRSGNREAAQQLLAELQQMMENLQAGMPPQMNQQQRQAWEAMRELSDLARQQQSLMDDTYNQAHGREQAQRNNQSQRPQGQQGQRGEQDGGSGQGSESLQQALQRLSQTQEALRKALADVMRRLGENGDIPNSLGNADQAMRDASQALGQGQPGDAVGPQGQALEGLRQGAQEALEQLGGQAQALEQGDQRGQGQANRPEGQDPFGRRYGDGKANSDRDTGIPGEAAVKRAREILEELRRRSTDPTRTFEERDYLERLLERF